jgi:hypothetical protein
LAQPPNSNIFYLYVDLYFLSEVPLFVVINQSTEKNSFLVYIFLLLITLIWDQINKKT